MIKRSVICVALLFVAVNVFAQTAPPVVEVASIKEMSRQDLRYTGLSSCPLATPKISGNRISLTGVTVCTLIRAAYSLEEFEISNAPDWTTKDSGLLTYDIQALAEGSEVLSPERARQLLQVLLIQRFQLKFHKEMRDLEVLALIVDKDGMKLTESRPSMCTGEGANYSSRFRISRAPDGTLGLRGGAFANCMKDALSALARSLTFYLHDPVVDRTGLNGEFTWELSWTDPSELASELKQRLGLRMVPRKEPIEVTVIDRVEKATAN